MAYIEILTADGLTVEQWDNNIFEEYIGQMWWKNLMGTSTNAVIQVKDDLTKSPGDAITLGVRGLVQGGNITGNNKASGNEGKVDFYNQRITIDNVRAVIKFEDVPMSQKRTGFDILMQGKEALVQEAQKTLDDDITVALSDTSNGRVRGRYLYGAADSNWNATHATALAAVDNTADQLTSSIIGACKRKAQIPVNATAKIRPMRIKSGKAYEEWFVYVGHTYAIRDLVNNDAAFVNRNLLLPPGQNSASPLYTGSSFKGSWDGVLIYEYDNITLSTNTNSVQTAHNLMLGAQAGAVCWGQRSKFGEEESDVGHDITYEVHEIRGVSKLYFNRTSVEDHGIIHSFTAAVAD